MYQAVGIQEEIRQNNNNNNNKNNPFCRHGAYILED